MEFSIGELARRSGYAVQTVRYYEQRGLMPTAARTAGGQRRYDEAQFRQLLFIRHARDLGFEVDAIRSLLRLATYPDAPCDSVDAIARNHLTAITRKIARPICAAPGSDPHDRAMPARSNCGVPGDRRLIVR